jgi:DNA-3-methyladenine glycosylase
MEHRERRAGRSGGVANVNPEAYPRQALTNVSTKLARDFFARSTLTVSRQLIGMHLVHQDAGVRRAGRIFETEAYLGPKDLAAHSARGKTPRNAVMFGPPGHAYVYFIYGFWNCVNVVTREEGVPQAVLIRALEPVEGIEEATWGPGLLCRAMHIDRTLHGVDLEGERLWIEHPHGSERRLRVARTTRIGVDYAGPWAQRLWRFFAADSPYVSTVSKAARARALKDMVGGPTWSRTGIGADQVLRRLT